MPFDNFYEESDKAARRWRKCVGAAFLLFIGYWAIALSIAPDPEPVEPKPLKLELKSEEPPPVVKFTDVERLRRVDELCTNLPKPEKFYFLERTLLVESWDLTLVQYSFKSTRGWSELMPVFTISMKADGWQTLPTNSSTFVKGDQTVAFSTGTANRYEIFCSEKPAKTGEAISFSVNDI